MTSFAGEYAGRRVFVTGHTGFKGAWLTAWLLQMGAQVCGYSIDIPTSPSLFEQCSLAASISHHVGDIRDTDHLSHRIATFRPDVVIHLAAQSVVSASYADPLETLSVNVLGTASVLQALRSVTWPCAVVIVASDKCYENVEQIWGYREIDTLGGKDVYSASKGAAEVVFSSFARSFFSGEDNPVRLASARAGNVIGGGDWAKDRIVADCIRAWNRDEAVSLRRPQSVRPWQHVLEPLGGYLTLAAALMRRPQLSGQSFNFGPAPDQPRSVIELLTHLAKAYGHPQPETAFLQLAEPPFPEAGLLTLNCEKARIELGWSAVLSFAETVQMTGDWYREAAAAPSAALQLVNDQIHAYRVHASSEFMA
jgi:CDP-glucose 4,6-dehydratase